MEIQLDGIVKANRKLKFFVKSLFYLTAFFMAIASLLSIYAFLDLGYDVLGLKVNLGHFEDASIHQIFRILEGKKLFTEANAEYTPLLYGPVYFYISAPFGLLFQKTFLSGRIVSYIATFLSVIFAALIFRKSVDAGKWLFLFCFTVFIGLFFSANHLIDYWLYKAKVDALFLLLSVVTTYYYFRSAEKLPYLFVSAFFGSLLFFTKQNGVLIPAFCILFYLIANKKRSALIFAIVFFIFSGIFFAFFILHSGEKFLLYTFVIPKSHPFLWKEYSPELLKFFLPFGILLLLFFYLNFAAQFYRRGKIDFWKILRRKLKTKKNFYPLFLLFSFFSISLVGRMKVGAVGNSWIWFIYALSLFSAIFLFRLLKVIRNRPSPKLRMAFGAFNILLILQFLTFRYDYFAKKEEIQKLKDRQILTKQILCGLEKPVLFPLAGYMPVILCNDDTTGFQQQSVLDIIRYKAEFDLFMASYKKAIESRYYKTVVLTTDVPLDQSEEGIKFIDFQLMSAKNQRQKDDLLAFRSIFEMNRLIKRNSKNIEKVSMTATHRMELPYFDDYYICRLK